MTITPLTIYLVGLTESVAVGAGALAAVAGIACPFLAIAADLAYDDDKKRLLGYVMMAVKTFVLALGVAVIMPSSKTVAAMIVLPAVVNNEKLQDIAGNGLEALRLLSDKYVKDLAGEKEAKK